MPKITLIKDPWPGRIDFGGKIDIVLKKKKKDRQWLSNQTSICTATLRKKINHHPEEFTLADLYLICKVLNLDMVGLIKILTEGEKIS